MRRGFLLSKEPSGTGPPNASQVRAVALIEDALKIFGHHSSCAFGDSDCARLQLKPLRSLHRKCDGVISHSPPEKTFRSVLSHSQRQLLRHQLPSSILYDIRLSNEQLRPLAT